MEKSALERHISKHAGGSATESKPHKYACDLCDYRSRAPTDLDDHKRVHSGEYYRCEFCVYQTPWKKCLLRHYLTHAPEDKQMKYLCGECGYMADQPGKIGSVKRGEGGACPLGQSSQL